MSEDEISGLFEDPEGFYPPSPPPTTQRHTLAGTGRTVELGLVGYSPLEAHHLWNGARVVADYMEAHPEEVAGRTVLELGAGAGLPSIVAGLLGARKVVMTDFPDADLVANMQKNIWEAGLGGRSRGQESTANEEKDEKDGKRDDDAVVVPMGFVWGGDPAPLLARLPDDEEKGFDVLVLADLVFRHSEHGRLVDTIAATMRRQRNSRALVFFTSYRPWLRHKDLGFFDAARERGFEVERVLERKMDRPLFEDDPGDEDVLRTVSGYTIRWPIDQCGSGL